MAEELREQLVQHNLPALRSLLAQAVAEGAVADDLVLFIADMRDGQGFAVAKAFGGATDEIRDRASSAGIPTSLGMMPLAAAIASFSKTTQTIGDGLKDPPPQGQVRLVIVADGRVQARYVDAIEEEQ